MRIMGAARLAHHRISNEIRDVIDELLSYRDMRCVRDGIYLHMPPLARSGVLLKEIDFILDLMPDGA